MLMFSYKIEHDFGLAPNPFWGVMTLAVCKGKIRRHKKLQIGDWIIGTGSQKLKNLNHIIYASLLGRSSVRNKTTSNERQLGSNIRR